jgi:hypothetical protein
MAAACVLASVSAGCHYGGTATVHHPAFEQLEQCCFGYEPTIWRDMPGDCQHAIRMIPDEPVCLPEKTPEPTPAEMSTPPTDDAQAAPDEATLDEVPEQGPVNLPRIVAPLPEDQPATTPAPADMLQDGVLGTPPSVTPDAVPQVEPAEQPSLPPANVIPETTEPAEPARAVEPAVEPAPAPAEPEAPAPVPAPTLAPAPAAAPKPAAEPTPKPASEPQAPSVTERSIEPTMTPTGPALAPVIDGPLRHDPPSAAAALFQAVSEALDSPATRPATAQKKSRAGGLARFISY